MAAACGSEMLPILPEGFSGTWMRAASVAPVVGTEVKAGEPMSFVQTYYGFEDVVPAVSGRIVAVCAKQGDMVSKGEILAFVQP